jgi:hypothetical protein
VQVNKQLVTYAYTSQTTRGPTVTKATLQFVVALWSSVGRLQVQITKLQPGFTSIMVYDGMVHGQKVIG